MIEPPRTPIRLTTDELSRLQVEVNRDAPQFADRLDRFLEVEQLALPWFRKHRILDLRANLPFPARRIYVAAGAARMRVLTGHLENLRAVAAADPPAELGDEASAKDYAVHCNGLAAAYPVGELAIASFDEIPFVAQPDERRQQTIDDLRARFAARIHAEERARTDEGWTFHSWLVASSSLIERTLIVPPDGAMVRRDTVHAAHLPVPYGTHWGMRNGRLVPIG
jgi:hypothetical protein